MSTIFLKELNRLRGICIFLVVIGHAIFKDILVTTNLNYSKNIYIPIFDFIYSFHMPLFFFMSGFFAKKILNIKHLKEYKEFMLDKFMKLMIPYFSLTVVATLIKLVLERYSNRQVELGEIIKIALFYPLQNPLKLLWYVYTLFLIFAIAPLLNKIPTKFKIALLLVLNLLPFYYGDIFYANGVIRYMIYFFIGMETYKKFDKFLGFKYKFAVSILSLILLFGFNMLRIENYWLINSVKFMTAMLGIVFLVNLVYVLRNDSINNTLNVLGKYSYDIYLLHWFTQMPIRVLYQKFHFNYNILVIVSFCMAFLIIPISKYIVRKNRILKMFLLGDFRKPNSTNTKHDIVVSQ